MLTLPAFPAGTLLDRYTVEAVIATGGASDGGPAIAADAPDRPTAVAIDRQGRFSIADLLRNRVRRVERRGTITTAAGAGLAGDAGGGGRPVCAPLNFPLAVAAGGGRSGHIADTGTDRVRKVLS